MTENLCEECGGSSFFKDAQTGETVCTSCGTVHSVNRLVMQKRRFFTQEEFEERESHSPTNTRAFDGGIASMIKYTDIASETKTLEERYKYNRLKRADKKARLHDSKMRNMSIATDRIRSIIQFMGLPLQVHEESVYIYRRALTKGLVRGRSIINVAAACVYLACRIHKVPRRIRDFEKPTSDLNKKAFHAAIRLLIKELGVKPGLHKTAPYIQQCVSKLKLPQKVERRAKEMLDELVRQKVTGGKNPAVLAATLVYLAARELRQNATQKHVSDSLGVTEVSLRNTMHYLREEGLFVLP